MQDVVEQLDSQRRHALFWLVLTFAAWQLGVLEQDMLPAGAPGWLHTGLDGQTALGAIAWLVSLLGLYLHTRRLRTNPRAAHALLDERFRMLRQESFVLGFWAPLVGVLWRDRAGADA